MLEVYGAMDNDFRNLLRQTAECHIDSSDTDGGLSDAQRAHIKGVLVSRYYTQISVATQRANVIHMRHAAKRVWVDALAKAPRVCVPSYGAQQIACDLARDPARWARG